MNDYEIITEDLLEYIFYKVEWNKYNKWTSCQLPA